MGALPPIILYENQLETYGISSVNYEDANYPIENAYDWEVDTQYKSTLSSGNTIIIIDKGAAGIVTDSIAIFNHNLNDIGVNSTEGAILIVGEADNPSFTGTVNLGSFILPGVSALNAPIYFDLTPGTDRYIRITISATTGIPEAGEIILSERLEFPVGTEFSYDPDAQEVVSQKYASSKGRVPSTGKKYSMRTITAEFKRLSQSFITSDLLPFLENHYTRIKPFWFFPDPSGVFGDVTRYWLMCAPDDPEISLPIYNDDIGYRNWTLKAEGVE